MSLNYLVIPDSQEAVKDNRGSGGKDSERLNEAPSGQRWSKLSSSEDNNCNGLSHIVPTHELIIIPRQSNNNTKLHLSPLEDTNKLTHYFEK